MGYIIENTVSYLRSLIPDLRRLLQERRIGEGIALLEEHRFVFVQLISTAPEAGIAVGCLAEWLDVGFEGQVLLTDLLQRFSKPVRKEMSLLAYVHLRLAEGFIAMRTENLTQALQHLETALIASGDLDDTRIRAIATLWKARCLRKAGEYDQALNITREGVEIASKMGLTYLGAVVRTLESWLLFQRGDTKSALSLLQEAETALRDTDDFITLGNIQSAYGRIALREGRYDHAMQYFEASVQFFNRRASLQGYLARSLTNIAQAKRFLAMELRRSIDARRERQRGGEGGNGLRREEKSAQLERMHELLRDARAALRQAGEIYRQSDNHHGAGNVDVNLAQIHLDLGNLDEAEERAAEAFELAASKTDYLLMCRARIVQAMIANARYEEQIGAEDDPSRYAQLAHDCAREAVDLGEQTESRRLLAQAYICRGLTLVNGFFSNTEEARACCHKAEQYLGNDRHDALWREVEILRSRVLLAGVEDPNLRAWSQGAVGDKSLQDVVADFEELLIRKVWEHEGRKVSRVAQKLAVSPKKIRRVLRGLGLLAEQV